MTGFGRGIAENDNYSLNIEIKSVNHRFSEIYLRLPKQLNSLEDGIKKKVGCKIKRGKIDIFIGLDRLQTKNPLLKLDKDLAIAYYKSILELSDSCRIPVDLAASELINMPGVYNLEAAEDDLEEISSLLDIAVADALDGLLKMRTEEGRVMLKDLTGNINALSQSIKKINELSQSVVDEQKQKIEQRIALLLDEVEVDQSKLANEIAFFADKVDINEELTRLASHIQQFLVSLQLEEPIGRKLDFILQEMLREINTIGSKSNNLTINNQVIESKNLLEKIKEQIQNIE